MKWRIALAIIFIAPCCTAQNNTINSIIKKLYRQPVYSIAHVVTEQSFSIPCSFGKANLIFPDTSINFTALQVTAIDLVFTDYPSDDALIKLNTQRLQYLFKKYPALGSNKNIDWKLVRQTDGTLKDPALTLFHGFVIYYRPAQNAATIKTDLIKLKELLTPKEEPVIKRNGFVTGDTTELRKQYEIEEYTTVLKLPVAEALQYVGIDEKEKVVYKKYDSLFVYVKPGGDSSTRIVMQAPPDSTVIKVLNRMQWNNMLVVADVTASTYAFSGQLLLWLKLHEAERRIKQFVFFNDGDDKDDENKMVGSTGGIYSTSSSVFEVVEQLVFKTMSAGNGGNIPENNIEALLHGLRACPDCASVVMIADNSSAVSDMALLKQVGKPVHIILCGVHDVMNTDYLNIAKSTGGSVHTAEEDILQLVHFKEGQIITLLGRNYVIKNGNFVSQ